MFYCPAELRVYALETTLPDFSVSVWARLAHHQSPAAEPVNGTIQQYMDILKLVQHGLLVGPTEPCDRPRWLYASETGRELWTMHSNMVEENLRWVMRLGSAFASITSASTTHLLDEFFASIAPTHCAGCGEPFEYAEIRDAMKHRNLCIDCDGKYGRCASCRAPFVSAKEVIRATSLQQGHCDECWAEMEEIPSDVRGKETFYGASRRSL